MGRGGGAALAERPETTGEQAAPSHHAQHGAVAAPPSASPPASPKAHHSRRQRHAAEKATPQQPPRERPRTGRVLFVLACVGVVLALLGLGGHHAAQDERVRAAVSEQVARLNSTLAEYDVSLDGLLERLANLTDTVSNLIGDDAPRPGQLAAQRGMKAHHPVVLVPGFVTSGLELWQGEDCAQSYFRQRLWGTLSMAQTLLADRGCWLRHMKLDPVTGSDPPGIKLRASKALEAIDYFVPGYWVFSKLMQSLADIGYDNNNMVAVPYDWRLPMAVMQKRDGFFTRLKQETELQYRLSRGIKPIIVSHSYGALVSVTFLNWVEQQEAGWVDKHLAGYVNLAGTLLGLPKALSPLLSGETRETVDMMAGLSVLVEQYLGKQSRAMLFRTWGSCVAMLPIGGSKVWGNATWAPDDDDAVRAAGRSYGGVIARIKTADSKLKDAVRRNDSSLLPSESLSLLRTTLHNWREAVRSLGGIEATSDDEGEDAAKAKGSGGEAAGSSGGEAAGSSGDAGIGSKAWARQKAAASAQQQVRFLDVPSAITSLALTAGEQFTRNMQRWSPAAQELDLDLILERLRKEAEAAAKAKGACKVEVGEYAGSCESPAEAFPGGSCAPGEAQAEGAAASAASAERATPSGSGSGPGAPSSSSGGAASGSSTSSATGDLGSLQHGVHGGPRQIDAVQLSAAAKAATQPQHGKPGEDPRTDEVRPVNPTRVPLPNAPDMRYYCLYGIGTPTERGYHYLKTRRGSVTEWSVNNMADDRESGLESGVQLAPDGDGTVPLLSLGALCAGGWKTRRLNPSGSEVVVREYPHQPGPVLKDARGGPGASTHVEILGNEDMLADLLAIVSGNAAKVGDSVISPIRSIAGRIPWDEL